MAAFVLIAVLAAVAGLLVASRLKPLKGTIWGNLAAALALGLGAYVVFNPLAALFSAGATLAGWRLMVAVRRGSLPGYAVLLVFFSVGSPILLFLVLNQMRPDLIAPMLDHQFGYILVSVVSLLSFGAAGAVLLVAFLKPKSPTAVFATWASGLVLCVAPSIFLVLFGPIVFAFKYGNFEASADSDGGHAQGTGDWGASCRSDGDCLAELTCGNPPYCTSTCDRDADCPNGWHCHPILDARDGLCAQGAATP